MAKLFISRFANQHVVDAWEQAFDRVPFNRFESAALRAFVEGFRGLIVSRDAVDDVREAYVWSIREDPNVQVANTQQVALFRATDAFFHDFYATVSKLSGIVARNSGTFKKNFSDNGPFLSWLIGRYPHPHDVAVTLEAARLFRAMLAHPQQFPPYDWATVVNPNRLTLVVLWGEKGRGQRPIPRGATTSYPLPRGDWHFEAPDEVSVTNCLGGMAEFVLADVLVSYSNRRAFQRGLTRDEAHALLAPELDVSAARRRAESAR